jgi:hypothetical protein
MSLLIEPPLPPKEKTKPPWGEKKEPQSGYAGCTLIAVFLRKCAPMGFIPSSTANRQAYTHELYGFAIADQLTLGDKGYILIPTT